MSRFTVGFDVGAGHQEARAHRVAQPSGHRGAAQFSRRRSWKFAQVVIDDHARTGFVQMHADERKDSAVEFLKAAVAHYAALGVKI